MVTLVASHILLPSQLYSEAEAKAIFNDIQKNPNQFGIMAGKISKCPSGTNNTPLTSCLQTASTDKDSQQCFIKYGGYLGSFTPDQMVSSFSNAVQKLKPNQIGFVYMPEFNGYTIIKRH